MRSPCCFACSSAVPVPSSVLPVRNSSGPVQPLPRLVTTSQVGGRPDVLRRADTLHRLAHELWCVAETPPTHLQRAVLLQNHLSPGQQPLRLTSVTALQLLGLPVPRGHAWANSLLRGRRPPHAELLARHLESVVHLSWSGARAHSRFPEVRIRKSLDLPTVLGPWLAPLVDPVEALVVAADMMAGWAITAALDALLSRGAVPRAVDPFHRSLLEGTRASQRFVPVTYTPDLVRDLLEQLPPTARAVRAVRAALSRTAPNTWSPMETLVRLIVVAAGFAEQEMNVEVRTPYGTRYLDLGWPERMVAMEFNGQVHNTNHAAYKDEMHRLEVLRDLGWSLRVLVYEDLADARRRAA
ncbi:DUF559 domain-containing protein [Kocuria varians]